jgi:hypothetical protein
MVVMGASPTRWIEGAQDMKIRQSGMPNWMIQFPQSQQQLQDNNRQWVPKDGSSTDGSGSSQGKTGWRSETSANDEVKPDVEKGSEEVAAEQNQVQDEKAKVSAEAGTSSR